MGCGGSKAPEIDEMDVSKHGDDSFTDKFAQEVEAHHAAQAAKATAVIDAVVVSKAG